MDTVTCILGSSQEEMMMLASGSEETSYLSSVTIYEVQIQHKASLLQLTGRMWSCTRPHAGCSGTS